MSFDLAIDYNTGDLLMAPNHDIQGRTGEDVFEQQIRIRLKVPRGSWELDERGDFGSRINALIRMPTDRAVIEVGAYVREALAPMKDIIVRDVNAQIDPTNARNVQLVISYQPRDTEDADETLQSISLTIPT